MGAARRLRSGRQADTVHGVKAVPKSIIDRIFPSRSNEHASYGGPADGHGYPLLINEDAPENYQDMTKYATPEGLSEVMR
jgi:hypothetical protein